jgi:hypothetical protein
VADIVFTTRLTEADWDDVLRGWRCPPLAVPGAVIETLYVDGNRIDTKQYEVLSQHSLIRWILPNKPERAVASVKLTEELTLGRDTDRWRKLAIILPVVATIVSAAITATAAYFSKERPGGTASLTQGPPPSEPLKLPNLDNTTVKNATSITPGQTASGVTALGQMRWFKFSVPAQGPTSIGVLLKLDSSLHCSENRYESFQ